MVAWHAFQRIRQINVLAQHGLQCDRIPGVIGQSTQFEGACLSREPRDRRSLVPSRPLITDLPGGCQRQRGIDGPVQRNLAVSGHAPQAQRRRKFISPNIEPTPLRSGHAISICSDPGIQAGIDGRAAGLQMVIAVVHIQELWVQVYQVVRIRGRVDAATRPVKQVMAA